jgi:hypothetical protein
MQYLEEGVEFLHLEQGRKVREEVEQELALAPLESQEQGLREQLEGSLMGAAKVTQIYDHLWEEGLLTPCRRCRED